MGLPKWGLPNQIRLPHKMKLTYKKRLLQIMNKGVKINMRVSKTALWIYEAALEI